MYPDERVIRFVSENFVPIKIHIKENPAGFKRFGAQWTPTEIIMDPGGAERYRFEGFMPADEFIAHLAMGLAKTSFAEDRFQDAEKRFREIAARHPDSEAAPEAMYWAGVSKYKATNDAQALSETAKQFQSHYSDSIWAKKASVWT